MAATKILSFSFVPHTDINDGGYNIILFCTSHRHQQWRLQKYYPSLLCLIPPSTMEATRSSFSFVARTDINDGGYNNIILLFCTSHRHQRWRLQ